jgi:hypothetical protein
MEQDNLLVNRFFEEYERAISTLDLQIYDRLYNDAFMFASPSGLQAIKKADFLKVLPKRQGFFKAIGLTSTTLHRLEQTPLDESHIMVKVIWRMRYEKENQAAITDESSATYLLYRRGDLLQIVFQYDHQDLMERARELGVLPAAG